MTEPDNITDKGFFDSFDFKGIEIQPLTYARRALILGLVNPAALSYMDAPTFLYGAICPERELIRARRTLEAFDTAVATWIERVKFSSADSDEAGRVIQALLEHSEENKAEPVTDASLQSDPLGN